MLRGIVRGLAYTQRLELTPGNALSVPTFRTMDMEGKLLPGTEGLIKDVSKEMLHKMLRVMIETEQVDLLYYKLQRLNNISFYMQNHGEEGLQAGCGAALHPDDWLYLQYRELGVLLYRGFTQTELAHQLYATQEDTGKGRQMPCHYGNLRIKAQTISSPLSTQVPQAAGLGYALRLQGSKTICATFFGDGSASEGDVHTALNFAATRKSQVLFFCRNNGYAISTPTKDQYGGEGIAERGVGYGMPAIRVDGNDALAVYLATKAARDRILSGPGPVLLEAMTYRRGHHSTSDDSTRYRSDSEIKHFESVDNPILRFWKFLSSNGFAPSSLEDLRKEAAERVLQAREVAKGTPPPAWEGMFEDVYDEPTEELKAQKAEFEAHYRKYRDYYDHKVMH